MYMNSPIGFYHQRFATWQLALPIPMKIYKNTKLSFIDVLNDIFSFLVT